MKRVFIIVACLATVACVGSKKSDDKSGDAKTPTHESMGGEERSNASTVEDLVVLTAENYQEMVMSSLENGDSEAFMAIMEQMTMWLDNLDEEERARADRAIEAWEERNAERKAQGYEKALTMPRMTSAEARSARATK